METLIFSTTHFNNEELVIETYTLAETVSVIRRLDAGVLRDPEDYLWSAFSGAYYMCVELNSGHRYPLPLVFKSHEDRDIAELQHQSEMLEWYQCKGIAPSDYFAFLSKTAGGLDHVELDYIKSILLDELRYAEEDAA